MTLAIIHERNMLDQNISRQSTALRVAYKKNTTDSNKKQQPATPKEMRSKGNTTHIKIRTERGFELMDVRMIAYCQADGNYTRVYLKNKQMHLISYALKHVFKMLPQEMMIRVHQSYVLNINCISRAILSGSDMIELTCGTSIPIARRRRKYVKSVLLKSISINY